MNTRQLSRDEQIELLDAWTHEAFEDAQDLEDEGQAEAAAAIYFQCEVFRAKLEELIAAHDGQ